MKIEAQFDENYGVIPEGTYIALATQATVIESDVERDRESYFQILWSIVEGTHQGKVIKANFYIHTKDQTKKKRALHKVASMNKELFGDAMPRDAQDYVGMKALLKVAIFVPQEGGENKNYVQWVNKYVQSEPIVPGRQDFDDDVTLF